MSRRTTTALVVTAGLAAAVAIVAASRGDAAGEAVPSYTRTVAPLIAEKCAGCHRLGGIAPFRLDTSAAAHKYASLIAASVSARTMPPWPPGAASPAYVGEAVSRFEREDGGWRVETKTGSWHADVLVGADGAGE